MSSRFEQVDLSAVRPISIADRESKISVSDVLDPAVLDGAGVNSQALLAVFPDILAARSLRRVAGALRTARDAGREIVWMIGAHTIKTGLSRCLGWLIDEGYITCVASTGSSVIHDLELAFFGNTSEDVARELPRGRFGMSSETADHFNAAVARADAERLGFGEAVGDYIIACGAPHAEVSLFAAAHRRGIPATVHVAFGTDITHQHPGLQPAAVGEATMRDFRIFTARAGRMFDRGVAVVFGSAVILPEVFLKAVSIQYNLGRQPTGVLAASFDMLPQYRVRENVLSRPFGGACEAHAITGHHEIMMPLLCLLLR